MKLENLETPCPCSMAADFAEISFRVLNMSLSEVTVRVPPLAKLLYSDVLAKRYDRNRTDSLLDPRRALTPASRNLVEEYYKQDFACLGYRLDTVQDLEWHHRVNPA